jgi:hypothetical protein
MAAAVEVVSHAAPRVRTFRSERCKESTGPRGSDGRRQGRSPSPRWLASCIGPGGGNKAEGAGSWSTEARTSSTPVVRTAARDRSGRRARFPLRLRRRAVLGVRPPSGGRVRCRPRVLDAAAARRRSPAPPRARALLSRSPPRVRPL